MRTESSATTFLEHSASYQRKLSSALAETSMKNVEALAHAMAECWQKKRQLFICGNGGSAGNAVHIANDLIYGVSKAKGNGIRCHALPANVSVVSCLANDEGYKDIFSYQLAVLANPGDLLLVLSGSGNSPNIIEAIDTGYGMGLKVFAMLGYDGGKALKKVPDAIHFPVADMQVSEDLQLVVTHMIAQWLCQQGIKSEG